MKDDEHLRWVFEQAMKAIDAYNDCWKLPEEVQSVINNNDEDLALKLCEDYNLCSNFLQRMCGLFGIINRNKSLLDKRAFITLGCANDTRGGDACGIMIDRKVDKGTEKNDQYFQIWYSKSALLKSTIRCNVALGHCRKASVGGVTADKAQPIIIKDDEGNIQFCLIHNGTIYNYKELAAKYIPEIKIDDLSDSQVMARIFYYSGYDVLGEYEGSGAFVIQDYRYNKTYMFKGESLGNTTTKNPEVERPLYFVKTGKSIVFSSIYSVLQGLYYELDVYNVPSNVLLECDGKDLYEVKKYDRTKCYHCKRYVTKTYSVINNDYFWEGLKSKTVSPIVDFDVESGLYMNASTGEDLHGVQYVSNYGYIAKYSTGFNKPYYFWYGLMINGEIAYNKLRELDTAKMPAHQLFQIAKRLSCNPTVYNKKYYVYDSSHKRVPFTDNYIFPLTGVEIVCSKKGKVIVVYDNNRIETTLPIELTEEAIDKIVNYVKNSIQ